MGAKFLFMDDNRPTSPKNIVDECLQSRRISPIWIGQLQILTGLESNRACLVVKGNGGRGRRVKFEPIPLKDPPCRAAMHVKSAESSNVLPLLWCGSQERGSGASSGVNLALDYGSKLRGPSPKAPRVAGAVRR
ncbi:hypothetical protein TNCV_1586561 [Trichonephila clavipes]|nr:hypothetical protein TNCV_1586561 [Trichonephila clavipes]